MQPYGSPGHDSGIAAYDCGPDWIDIPLQGVLELLDAQSLS